jgi:hypothetical protein
MHTTFWSENLKGRDQSEDIGVDGNIRSVLREIWCKGVDWIYLVYDRDHWWVRVNTIMKLQGT